MKILIIGPAWIGDMIMAQSLFKLLHQQFPAITLEVAAPAWTQPLLSRMPEVTASLGLPWGHGELALGKRYRLARHCRAQAYDWAIVLPNSWKSALVPALAGISRRTGYRGEWRYGLLNDVRQFDPQRWTSRFQHFAALGVLPESELPANAPWPRLLVTAEQLTASLNELNLTAPTSPLLALCPGAEFGPARRWPAAYYAAVAQAKLDAGWEVWLFGSAKDQAVTAEIDALTAGRCTNLAGRTSLSNVIDLLSLATAVVANDSGLMHMAAALALPVVALYGCTPPELAPPLSKRAQSLSLNLACSPCFQRECPLGHFRCLRDLLPARVLEALTQVQLAA